MTTTYASRSLQVIKTHDLNENRIDKPSPDCEEARVFRRAVTALSGYRPGRQEE